jgi:hypothetical protein
MSSSSNGQSTTRPRGLACVATCRTEPLTWGRTVDDLVFDLANLPEAPQGRDVILWEGPYVRAILTSDGTTIHVNRTSHIG